MIRAVIYCRCSTEEESQKNALEKHVVRQHYWGKRKLGFDGGGIDLRLVIGVFNYGPDVCLRILW